MGILSNLGVLVGLAVFLFIPPSVLSLLLCIYTPQCCVAVAYVAYVTLRHPQVLPDWAFFNGKLAKVLLTEGTAVSVNQSLLPWLQREGVKIALLKAGGGSAAGLYAILMQLVSILGGLVTMVTVPLYAAIGDRTAARDHAWNAKTFRTTMICGCLFAGAICLVLTVEGDSIIKAWIGKERLFSRYQMTMLGLYFVSAVLIHILYVFTVAQTFTKSIALIALVQAVALIATLYCLWPLDLSAALLGLVMSNLFGVAFSVYLIWQVFRCYREKALIN